MTSKDFKKLREEFEQFSQDVEGVLDDVECAIEESEQRQEPEEFDMSVFSDYERDIFKQLRLKAEGRNTSFNLLPPE